MPDSEPLPAQGTTSWYNWAVEQESLTDEVAGRLSAATLLASFETDSHARSESLRIGGTVPLHPSPPTVTLGAGNAATSLTGSTADIAFTDTALRFTACNGTEDPAVWYRIGYTPTSASFDRGYPFSVDFNIDTADFEFKIAGSNALRSYKVWIDGQPLTNDPQAGPGATSSTHRLRFNFGSRRPRHFRIMTDAGIVGLTVGANDTVWASTKPFYSKRVYFLGDSFTGSSGATYGLESYVYKLCDAFGWEPMMGGQAGTGYLTDNGGTGFTRTTFQARATTDVAATNPGMVIVYGGTNDPTSGLQTAAATTYSNLATAVPGVPVYVFGVQYPSGATDTTRDTKDASISAAAAAAANVALFTSVKTWFTGTGRVGATTGSGNSDIYTSSDALHPTAAGHAYIAARMAAALTPTYIAY